MLVTTTDDIKFVEFQVFIPSLQEAESFWLLSALFNGGASDRGEELIPVAFVDPNLLQGTKTAE